LKNDLPSQLAGKFNDWAFGCDICQDVCPWNKFSKSHQEPLFNPDERLLNYSKKEWEEITEDVFQEIFKKSAVKRTKYEGFTRNIRFLDK
jgi:epoxyqueuosine reductase